MPPRRGTVWHGERRVGELREDDAGRIRFAYDLDWLDSGFPISLRLPLEAGDRDAHAFFAGLLPEGRARHRITRRLRLDPQDDLALLLAIGADGAGALAVLPEGETPMQEPAAPVPFADGDLEALVRSRGQADPSPTGRPPRFSLAGAQDKVSAIFDGQRLYWPDARHPSSHILKLETFRWVCFAEHAAHDLARRAGLRASHVHYLRYDGDPELPYLRIERYDRARVPDGSVVRLHQEDVAQALGYDADAKYEGHGGPSLGEVAALLRRHSKDPTTDLAALRDWQIFNYLIGNSDGHAKNLSLLYSPGEPVPVLAPFYDLVCIELLLRIRVASFDRAMAFRIGDHAVPEEVGREDWGKLARAMGLPPKPLLRRLEELATALPALARQTRQDFAARFGDNQAYDRFEETVRDRCHWVCTSILAGR
ncbi:MAG: type II toxin-antitoxin system HipA family toxin [Myxococcota bacterium]